MLSRKNILALRNLVKQLRLIKLFRRTYGKTPVEYRKQWTRFPRPYDSE